MREEIVVQVAKVAKEREPEKVRKRMLTNTRARAQPFQKKPWLFGLWFCSAEKVAKRSPIDWLVEVLANGFDTEIKGSERDGMWRGDLFRLLRLFASSSKGEPNLLWRSSGSGAARLADRGAGAAAAAAGGAILVVVSD
jgi:hypothetical protein